MSIMTIVLIVGLAFTVLRALNQNFTIWEFLVTGTMFRFISKLPLITVNYGNLLSLFMDNIFEQDIQLMFNLKDEFGTRPEMLGKLEEYFIPSLAINAIIIQLSLYFITYVLNVAGYFMKNKLGKIFQVIHYGVMSVTMIDILTYCFVETNKRNVKDGLAHFWILSLIMIILVTSDVILLIFWSWKATFDQNVIKSSETDSFPAVQFSKHCADAKTYG